MIAMALRLGKHPRAIITTTPKPKRLIRDLVKRNGKDVVITTASTYDNLDNLAPSFRAQILQYEGTKLGRQEIHAEILDPESEGVVSRAWIKKWPANKPLPAFEVVLMSLDTAFTEQNVGKNETDPSACSVWGGFIYDGKPGVMLLDCWQERLNYPSLLERTKRELKARYGDDKDKPLIKPIFGPGRGDTSGKGIDLIVIEDKGSGISLRQSLASQGIAAHPYNPGRADKLARLHIVSPLFSQGLVWVVESDKREGEFRSWAEPLVSQVCSYSGKDSIDHDDLLDTTTQGLRVLNDLWLRSALEKKPLRKAPDPPTIEGTQRRENPYAA
jgi:predicted phage terminase large subunit-like protein